MLKFIMFGKTINCNHGSNESNCFNFFNNSSTTYFVHNVNVVLLKHIFLLWIQGSRYWWW